MQVRAGEGVLIPQPSYMYPIVLCTLADGVPATIELEERDQFKLTRKASGEDYRQKILVLPFPTNPTGAIMEKEELKKKL